MRATYSTITMNNGRKARLITIDIKAKEYDRACEILTEIVGDGEWSNNWCGDEDYLTTCMEVFDRDDFENFMIDWKEAKKHR